MKTSEMIVKFAGDYIETGDSMEQKQSRLNAACTAWNIASLPKHQRRKALQHYLKRYRALNPGTPNTVFLRKDMEQLIKEKIRMFGQVKKPILQAEIRKDGERYNIYTVSMPTEEEP